MGAYPATRGGSVNQSSPEPTGNGANAESEVVDLCRDLIRIDTSNYGGNEGPGERAAAEYVAEKLAEVGLEPQIFESSPGRASTVARIAGEDPSRPALLIHGHTDVVPANADGLDARPLLRGDRRRLRLGARRRRHEGHGRDDARGRTGPAAQRAQATPRRGAGLPRRRGGRRRVRGAAPGRQPPRPLRGRDRGDRRSGRLLLHGEREPAAVSRRDRPEGHALDAADRGRHRRATVR